MGQALVALATRQEPAGRVAISYADLGVEELGAVYERVIGFDDSNDIGEARQRGRHGALRKDTGTFYTPQALADFVVQRMLAPLVEGRTADRLLDLASSIPPWGPARSWSPRCDISRQRMSGP